MRLSVLACVVLVMPRISGADGSRLIGDDTFAVRQGGPLVLDGGLFVGEPAALPTGMSTGFGLGITRLCGCHLAYGARVSWSNATEPGGSPDGTSHWTVSQSDYRLRAIGAIRHTAGRGTLSLRLGAGATFVHEVRDLNQGARSGNPMTTRAIATLPAADLDGVVELQITGAWLFVLSGGPTVDYVSGHLHGGWDGQLGVAWRP